MDIDMDIDLTVDMADDPELARYQADAAALDMPVTEEYETMNGVEEPVEEGEVDQHGLVPKIHVRGVSSFKPNDVDDYVGEHFSRDLFKKVEWVDDNSLNLVYDTELAAREALEAFSAEEVSDPLEVRPAKRLSTFPDTELFVRQAVESDVKVKGAAQYSRFYLDNPEYDPESRKRQHGQRGYRERDYRPKRQRRNYEDDRHSRRSSREESAFDENMYDDEPKARTQPSAPRSITSDSSRRKVQFDEDLFGGRQSGRLRNRSASPARDGDGRYGFDDNQPTRRTARARSPTPPHMRKSRENRAARDAARKELFPSKKTSALDSGREVEQAPVELFPVQSPNKSARELFPHHRRREAKDIGPDEVTEAIGKYHPFDGAMDASTDGHSGRRPDNSERRRGEGKDLFSRINGGAKTESSYGRLGGEDETGFSFKGAGQDAQGGFSILGASRDRVENPLVKELFPMKAGSSSGGKDLFDGRIKGRGNPRRRAEDLF